MAAHACCAAKDSARERGGSQDPDKFLGPRRNSAYEVTRQSGVRAIDLRAVSREPCGRNLPGGADYLRRSGGG